MCVVVDDPWEMLWCDTAAVAPDDVPAECYECHRSFEVGEEHTHGYWGPIDYRECEIEGCDHEECDDGDEYICDDVGEEMRFCRQCLAARVWLEKVCLSWLFGRVLEDLEEHFREEMFPIRSLPLGRLVVASRRKWRRRDGTLWSPDVLKGWADQGYALVAADIAARRRVAS